MPLPDPHAEHLDRLRGWRNRPAADWSLAFVAKQFKQEIEQPHKQVGRLVAAWEKLLPARLADRTKLVGLRGGVLTVEVPDSSTLFELDGLLRGGLLDQLRQHGKSTLRRVRLQLANGKKD